MDFVISAPLNLGQGHSAQAAFLLPHGVTLGTVIEPDQNGGAGFKLSIGPETHATRAEVQHLSVMMNLGIELAAD